MWRILLVKKKNHCTFCMFAGEGVLIHLSEGVLGDIFFSRKE
jgi:hypothetical protein